MTKYFLDTIVIVRAITRSHPKSVKLFLDTSKEKVTNEYVIMETRKVLKDKFWYSEFQVNGVVNSIRNRCFVVPTPPPNRFKKLKIRDKADKPVVQSAIDEKCVLVTDDARTYRDAKKYILTCSAVEIYKK